MNSWRRGDRQPRAQPHEIAPWPALPLRHRHRGRDGPGPANEIDLGGAGGHLPDPAHQRIPVRKQRMGDFARSQPLPVFGRLLADHGRNERLQKRASVDGIDCRPRRRFDPHGRKVGGIFQCAAGEHGFGIEAERMRYGFGLMRVSVVGATADDIPEQDGARDGVNQVINEGARHRHPIGCGERRRRVQP